MFIIIPLICKTKSKFISLYLLINLGIGGKLFIKLSIYKRSRLMTFSNE